jgi:DNA polymerase-3 subunit delta
MAALTLDALLRNLKKGAPDPVYLLHGDEDALKDEAVRALLDAAVDPAARDFNVDSRFAADLDAEALHALVNTPPMLVERRAVVLRGLEQMGKRHSKLRDELLRYLAAPNPTTVLVLVVGAGEDADAELARHATAVAIEPLAPDRIPKWVAHRARALRLTLAPEAVELLIAAVGNDLSTLARELEKLAALAGDRQATAADVSGLVGVRHGETVHDLVDAALERRAAAAAALVAPVLEQAGMSGVRILTLLGTHLLGTALACAERNRGTALPPSRLEDAVFRHIQGARPYGLRNWKEEAARWARWSEQWSAPDLSRALRAALGADRALKSTTVTDDRGIVVQLVLGFAATRQEAA